MLLCFLGDALLQENKIVISKALKVYNRRAVDKARIGYQLRTTHLYAVIPGYNRE